MAQFTLTKNLSMNHQSSLRIIKRDRDDTKKQEQNKITDWMNENICKDKIKLKVESMGDEVK